MRYYLILVVILRSFIAVAQPHNFILKGHSDLPERFIYLMKFSGPLELNLNIDTISINAKGEFNLNYYLHHPQRAKLIFGKKELWLWTAPQFDITLKLTDSIPVVTGPGSIYTNYYIDARRITKELFREYENRNPGYRKEWEKLPDAYFKITDSILQGQLNYLNGYFTQSNLPSEKEFIEREKSYQLYQDMYYKVQSSDTAFKKIAWFQEKLHLPNLPAFGFSNEISMNERKFLALSSYQVFVSNAIPLISRRSMTEKGLKFSFDLWMDMQMDLIDQLSHDPYCNIANKTILINQFIKQIENTGRIQWSDKLYSLIAHLQSKDIEHILQNSKDKLDLIVKEIKFSKGTPAPSFALIDTDGKIYTLADFKGKKVYIDVWATWCKPCIELQPAWDNLLKTYSQKDSVIFISVSMDQTKEKWLKYLKQHKLLGLLLYAGDNVWESSFAINYNIQNLPRFILIDEKGRFLANYAPHPDETEKLEKILRPE